MALNHVFQPTVCAKTMWQGGAQHGQCGWGTKCGGEAEDTPAGLTGPAKHSGKKMEGFKWSGRVGGCNRIRFPILKCPFWSGQWRAGVGGGPEWTQEDWLGGYWHLLLNTVWGLCPFVNVDVYCIHVGAGLFFCSLIWLSSFVNSEVTKGGDSVLYFSLRCDSWVYWIFRPWPLKIALGTTFKKPPNHTYWHYCTDNGCYFLLLLASRHLNGGLENAGENLDS